MTAVSRRLRRLRRALEPLLFAHRRAVLALFALLTALLGWQAAGLPFDAAQDRALPYALHGQPSIDGANPVRIAVLRGSGSIYDRAFLVRLKAFTEGIALLPGIDRPRLRSLFTPELRHVEVRESRYYGTPVVPAGFDPEHATRADLIALRAAVQRSGVIGRYVTRDQRGVLIEAAWLTHDPATGERWPQRVLAQSLEDVVRVAEATGGDDFSIHVLGAPVLAEALAVEAEGALLLAAAATVLIMLLLVFALGSLRMGLLTTALLPVAVVWQLGVLRLAGLVLDPDAVWAIAIAAAAGLAATAQLTLRWLQVAAEGGRAGFEASLATWRERAGPLSAGLAISALAAAALAAVSAVPLTRQVAIVAAVGIAAWLPLVAVLLPVLLSGFGTVRIRWRLADGLDRWLAALAGLSRPAFGVAALIAIGALSGFSAWQQRAQPVEPAGADLARLSPDNPVRIEAQRVASAFPRTVQSLRVIAEASADACTDPEALEQLDALVWRLENLPAVDGVTALPQALKRVLSAFGDGSPKFRALSQSRDTLTQAMAPIDASAGLHAADCTVLPITLQLRRRDAATLASVAAAVAAFNVANADDFRARHREADAADCTPHRLRAADGAAPTRAPACPLVAKVADGPLGLALARQAAVADSLLPSALVVGAVLALGAWLLLGDALAMLAVMIPLAFASWLALGLIATSGAALTLLTLPLWLAMVVAGFGSYLPVVRATRTAVVTGLPVPAALRNALRDDGRPLLVLLVMAAGFAVWIAAGYPAQRGVGKLLAIGMATLGVVGLTALPALIALLLGGQPPAAGERPD